MKTSIDTIRKSISSITRILSNRSITVTQVGLNAYVEYTSEGIPFRVNIPSLPDLASDELINAIHGFLDHEVGHLIFTNFIESAKFKDTASKLEADLYAIIEDVRIESEMCKAFKGSEFNLENTGRFVIEKHYATMENIDNEGNLLMPVLRAWGNQKAFIEFMADKWQLVESMTDKMKGRIGRLNSLQSTHESTELAKELAVLLSSKTKIPQLAPQTPSPFKIPIPPSATSPEELEEPEQIPPSEMSDLNFNSNEVEPAKDESLEEPKSNFAEQKSESEVAAEEEEDVSISAGAGIADEGKILSGTDNARMEETTDSDGELPDEVEELEEEEQEEEKFTGIPDFDQILSNSINEMSTRAAVDNFDAGIYSVYTRDNDRVEPHKIRRTTQDLGMASVIEMDERVKHVTGTMQKTLERLVFAKTNCRNVGGKTRGRINSNSLFKLKVGDSRVFKQKEENKSDEVVVSLLIDCSGSMRNDHKIDIAMQSAFALAGTLSHLNIPFEILGFTTINMDKVRGLNNAVRDADRAINEISEKLSTSRTYLRHNTAFSRVEPLYIPVFKGFNEKFGRVQKLRMIDMMTKTTALNNNIDGESLEIAFNRLSKQHEKGKYMMVLSDGNPVGRGKSEDLIQSLTDVVKNIEAKGTKIIGIGIVSEDVTRFYKDSVVVNNVSELPHVMMKELRHILNA